MNTLITGDFWKEYQKTIKEKVIPYQWKALNDQLEYTEPSHAIKNFKIAAGLVEDDYFGMVFQDSDVYKWLESVAYTLQISKDKQLEEKADELISFIRQAQLDDGYINTYYQLKEGLENRWTNLRDNHELYCAGHLIEAAVAYYETTGKDSLLKIAIKFADYIDNTFGYEENKLKGYPGHQEIELALIRLYAVTKKDEYLNLSSYFIEERGKKPNYFDLEAEEYGYDAQSWWHGDHEYSQSHDVIRNQEEAVGHSVRAVYYYAAATDIARIKNDHSLKQAVKKLWNNVITKKMFVNGGIGASAWGEAFSDNYDLPNDTTYNETCASVGLAFWAKRMIELDPDGSYGDVLENAIYNGVLCGMNIEGNRFLYVNPLQIDKKNVHNRRDHKHVTPERQKWFNCACCPPNLARLVSSIGNYYTTIVEDNIYVNLYGESSTILNWKGSEIELDQVTNYPWDGMISVKIKTKTSINGKIGFRIPKWSSQFSIYVNGNEYDSALNKGYVIIERNWQNGDEIDISLDMSPKKTYAKIDITEDIGKVAITRGPLLYAFEEKDNGTDLGSIWLNDDNFKVLINNELLSNANYISVNAKRLESINEETYSFDKPKFVETDILLIPYFMWGNRGYGEVRVWINDNF